MNEPAILASGLTKAYGRHRGIVDLDLAVQPGEVFGYLGPNGAKTTTIRLLLDCIRPTRGAVGVLGLRSHQESREIRRRVGYLPGELCLYSSLRGGELVSYFAHLRDGVVRARVDEPARHLDCGGGLPAGRWPGLSTPAPDGGASTGPSPATGVLPAARPASDAIGRSVPGRGLPGGSRGVPHSA